MVYFKKTKPAPNSLKTEKLKRNGKYNKDDVVKQLVEDFCGKCYICEDKSSSLNVEHFIPHKGNNNLKFDWNNLFLSCSHCNNVKLDKFDNILNCTIKDHCVDTAIAYKFKPHSLKKNLYL